MNSNYESFLGGPQYSLLARRRIRFPSILVRVGHVHKFSVQSSAHSNLRTLYNYRFSKRKVDRPPSEESAWRGGPGSPHWTRRSATVFAT
jgi:hypothetical protein